MFSAPLATWRSTGFSSDKSVTRASEQIDKVCSSRLRPTCYTTGSSLDGFYNNTTAEHISFVRTPADTFRRLPHIFYRVCLPFNLWYGKAWSSIWCVQTAAPDMKNHLS